MATIAVRAVGVRAAVLVVAHQLAEEAWAVEGKRSKVGSALVLVLWIITILSLLVVNFADEAFVQSKVNLHMMERVRLDQLLESGRILAEVIAIGAANVSDAQENEDLDELLEKDKWLREKRRLKVDGKMLLEKFVPEQLADLERLKNGGVDPDAKDRDDSEQEGMPCVTIEISAIGGGEAGNQKININRLYNGSDGNQKWQEWWEMILDWAGVPEDDWPYFFHSWQDWRDEDSTMSHSDYGAEEDWYADELEYEDEDREKYKPRNGPIPDLKELAKIRAFMDHPALLTGGGDYYAEVENAVKSKDTKTKKSRGARARDEKRKARGEKRSEDEMQVKCLLDVFDVEGGEKININLASPAVLATIPGIRQDDDPEKTEEIVAAIVAARESVSPNGKPGVQEEGYGLIKDWNDLKDRVEEVENAASDYIVFSGGAGADGSQYKMRITAEAMNISHTIEATVVIKEKKLHYLSWSENP